MTPSSFHALRFGRAATSYESHAWVQEKMAGALIELWGERPPAPAVLEFGCGTGVLTAKLRARFPAADVLATDASLAMLEEARRRLAAASRGFPPARFARQDARGEDLPVPEVSARAPHDLLAANALVQWFPDLEGHFRFAAALTKPGGSYLVSGFSRSNFPELNALLAEPPFSYGTFPGHEPAAVERAAAAAGWNATALYAWEEKEILPSPREVLRRMQALGSVRDPREGGRMNRGNLEHLTAEYARRFAEGDGVRLTWKPWAALLSR